jgi:predicted dithiol-disulfide oxidoreductase (DUF899 family)
MAIETRFNVQNASHGTALYLDVRCEWTTDAEAAFAYDCEDEANEDADKHGGEVFKFQRWAPGHNERARLEAHFIHQLAAE